MFNYRDPLVGWRWGLFFFISVYAFFVSASHAQNPLMDDLAVGVQESTSEPDPYDGRMSEENSKIHDLNQRYLDAMEKAQAGDPKAKAELERINQEFDRLASGSSEPATGSLEARTENHPAPHSKPFWAPLLEALKAIPTLVGFPAVK
jgi:hypothetical protein